MSLTDKPLNDAPVTDNRHHHRFELKIDGKLSIVEYQQVDDETIALTHTEVDPSLEGQGVGSYLVNGVLEYVERNNLKIVPLCQFVKVYIKRHPEWNRVVSTSHSAQNF